MKFLKNAIAFFAMLAVAAAGIFLPDIFSPEKNGEEQLGAVRQPDGDYYTGDRCSDYNSGYDDGR